MSPAGCQRSQQGMGGRRCGDGWGARVSSPPSCPTCQSEVLVGAWSGPLLGTLSLALLWQGNHSSHLAEQALPGTYRAVCVGTRLYTRVGPKVTFACALIWQETNVSLSKPQAPLLSLPTGGSRKPIDGQLGAAQGPSHLLLPEAGARDSNGAFRLVRASYCR